MLSTLPTLAILAILSILSILSSSAHLGEHSPLEALQQGGGQQGEGLDALACEARPGGRHGEGRLGAGTLTWPRCRGRRGRTACTPPCWRPSSRSTSGSCSCTQRPSCHWCQVLAAAPVVGVEEVGRLAEVPGLHRHHRHGELGQLQPQHAAKHNQYVECTMFNVECTL